MGRAVSGGEAGRARMGGSRRGSPGRRSKSEYKSSSLYDDDDHETSPLLPLDNAGRTVQVPDHLYGNEECPKRGCNRLPYWAIILSCYVGLLMVYAIAYVLSPPPDKWEDHLEQCPAQKKYCVLLDSESYLIQCVLCITIGSVLLVTWLLEKPRRPFVRFVADNSKSCVAALMTHFLAGASAILIHQITSGRFKVMDCDWYIIVFVWDSCVGVSLTLILHQWTAKKMKDSPRLEFMSRIGDYESRPDPVSGFRESSSNWERFDRWGYQMLHWLLCAVCARVVDFGILVALSPQLARVAAGLGWWACTKQQVQMKQWLNILVLPILLDSVQFVVQNYFLKNQQLLKEEVRQYGRTNEGYSDS